VAEVGVILGSKSDLPLMESCTAQLTALGIDHELKVCSAHRDPAGVMERASSARERGLRVLLVAEGPADKSTGEPAGLTALGAGSALAQPDWPFDGWAKLDGSSLTWTGFWR